MLPYGKQSVDESDIKAVVKVLKSEYLTTGPMVKKFEKAFAEYIGTKYAVSVSNGTAALHCAMFALNIGLGDELIVPPITFVSTANSIIFQRGTPIFSDVTPQALLLDPELVKSKITKRTKGIISVDYAGQPCDYDRLSFIADQYGLPLVVDGCHALGAKYKNRNVGTLGDMTIFSFHPVKHITTGEGGMVTTDNKEYYEKLCLFRNHGIADDFRKRELKGTWYYEMGNLGFNYRLADIQCALGLSQLARLPEFIRRRREISIIYNSALKNIKGIEPLCINPDVHHAFHLYVIRILKNEKNLSRADFFLKMRSKGIGVNVHYYPVYLQPFYRKTFGFRPGLCPIAEKKYEEIVSLPIFPAMSDSDVRKVINAIKEIFEC